MNLIQELRDAARRLTEIVSREINFHGNDAHARIVRVQRREHQMEERVGVFKVAAPSVEMAMDQVERKFLAMDGEFEKTLGLLLRSETAEFHGFLVIGVGFGGENESWRRKIRGNRARGSGTQPFLDRKSTRLNSSHSQISYAVFC